MIENNQKIYLTQMKFNKIKVMIFELDSFTKELGLD